MQQQRNFLIGLASVPSFWRMVGGRTHSSEPERAAFLASSSLRTDRARRIIASLSLGLVLVLSGFAFFWNLNGSFNLGDESIHVRVIQEMRLSGRWWQPTYHGEPYFNKPPLKMWLTFIPIRLLGDHNYSYRLIDALAGVGTILLTAQLGYLLFGSRAVGFVAALVLLGSPLLLFRHNFREAVQDGPVVFLCTLAMFMGWKALALLYDREGELQRGERRRLHLYGVGIGLAVGCAVMTKWVAGLLPLILIGCYSVLSPKLLTRLWFQAKMPLLIAAFLSGALPALYVGPHYLFNRQALESAATTQIAERLITKGVHHVDDWTFYFRELFEEGAGGPPWVIIASLAICAVAAIRLRSRPLLFILIWTLVPLIGFSLMKSRLPWYIYPIFPSLALMVGYAAVGALRMAVAIGRRAISTRDRLVAELLIAALASVFSLACLGFIGKRLVKVTKRILAEGGRLEIDVAVDDTVRSLARVPGSRVLFFDYDPAKQFAASQIDRREEIYLSKLIPYSLSSSDPAALKNTRCLVVVTTADHLNVIRREREVNRNQVMKVANKRRRNLPEFVFVRLYDPQEATT